MTLTSEVMEALGAPFPTSAIGWKPGATTKDKTKALGLAYVDPRYYMDRLNEVAGAEWTDHYGILVEGSKVVVTCHLQIFGVTRTDVGEDVASNANGVTSAAAQAFKRACVKFGLGAYLYRMPQTWASYDGNKKRFSREGFAVLDRAAEAGPPDKRPATPAITFTDMADSEGWDLSEGSDAREALGAVFGAYTPQNGADCIRFMKWLHSR